MGFGTRNDEAATTIFPFVAAGFAGSNVTVPDIPLALPLMASSGASSLNTALFTPLGSLKSNVCGAANAAQVAAMTMNRVAMGFFIRFAIQTGGVGVGFLRNAREAPARIPPPSNAAARKSSPGRKRFSYLMPSMPVTSSNVFFGALVLVQ